MTWFRVDDVFPEHPKWAAIEEDPALWASSMALWMAIGCYCARNLTDGFISEARCLRVSPMDRDGVSNALRAMVRNGLLLKVDGGYQMNDYLDYNPSREETLKKREENAERQRRYREKKAARKRGGAPRNALRNSVTSGVTNTASNDPPARPGPTPPKNTHSARVHGGSLGELPHPSGNGMSLSSASYVLDAWDHIGEAHGLLATHSHSDRAKLDEIETAALKAARAYHEGHDATVEETFMATVLRVLTAYAKDVVADDSGRLEWRPGWVTSRWGTLTKRVGVVPKEAA